MKIILLSGKARNGKDTTALMLKEIYEKDNKKVIILSYSFYLKEYAKKISNWDGKEENKPRDLLQQLGTEIIRNNIDELFFVKRMIEDIKVYSYYFDIIIISDVRLKNEIVWIKSSFENVYPIRIIRPNFNNGLSEEQKRHITEVDLDDYDFKYKIVNDKTLVELNKKVEELVEVLK
ncbi:MAG: hypothetical protein NC181_03910 [Clostridium sp.]|nr:hypothetical protein [Clostridium sp.]MCM1444388.1 hypothetical protein [Candidatus Amulumruptor caecigallinarius]